MPWPYLMPIALGPAMFAFIRHRQRQLGVTESHVRWKALPKERRRRIWSAVKQGQALSSPEDAALAVEAIDASQRNLLTPRRRGPRLLLDLGPILWLAFLLSEAHADVKRLVIYGWPVLILLALGPTIRFVMRGRRAALQQARTRNEQVVASSHGLAR
jgi:hypothetical protein